MTARGTFVVIIDADVGPIKPMRVFGTFRTLRSAERAAQSVPDLHDGYLVQTYVVPVERIDEMP